MRIVLLPDLQVKCQCMSVTSQSATSNFGGNLYVQNYWSHAMVSCMPDLVFVNELVRPKLSHVSCVPTNFMYTNLANEEPSASRKEHWLCMPAKLAQETIKQNKKSNSEWEWISMSSHSWQHGFSSQWEVFLRSYWARQTDYVWKPCGNSTNSELSTENLKMQSR